MSDEIHFMNDIPKYMGEDKVKISVFVTKEAGDVYRIARQKGYNLARIVREAASKAILEYKDKILTEQESA